RARAVSVGPRGSPRDFRIQISDFRFISEFGFSDCGGRVSALLGLQCHLCKTMFPAEALYVCDRCLGPLEPAYDYGAIRLTRETIEKRPKNLWRYRELLPIVDRP